MSYTLTRMKECYNCSALIEARAESCHICNKVFDIPILTEEEASKTYKEDCEELNNAFFRFENFMYGSATTYESFNFDRAFTVLFIKTRETKNYTPENFSLLNQYWSLTNQIQYDLDKCNFDNTLAVDNTAFETDSNSICAICHKRLHEFLEFSLPDDITTERRLSVVDIKSHYFEESSENAEKKPSGTKSKKKKKQSDKNNQYDKLINDIEFVFKHNYPGFETSIQFYHNAKESVRKFKYVTPLNLKGFSDTDLKLALKHYAFVIDELLARAFTNFKTIENWLVKYHIPYHLLFNDIARNELVNFLNEKLPSLRFSLSPEYNKDQEHIQYDFFNYWYGFFLLEASNFIQELNEIVTSENSDIAYKSEIINVDSMAIKNISFEPIIPSIPKTVMDLFPKDLLKENAVDTKLSASSRSNARINNFIPDSCLAPEVNKGLEDLSSGIAKDFTTFKTADNLSSESNSANLNDDKLPREFLKSEDCLAPSLKPTAEKLSNYEIKQSKLKSKLEEFGFLSIDKIQTLEAGSIGKIYQLLSDNNLPYKIALIDYLGFFEYLYKQHCHTKDNAYLKLSEILNEDYRSVKGNLLVLNSSSKENRTRYTAHNHKENVERDYQSLK